MDRKKRVLFVNEAHCLSTGFSTIGYEVLNRLHKTGKYELFELGSYVHVDDSRLENVPWKAYGTIPARHDKRGLAEYQKHYTPGQFSSLRFNDILLETQADIVLTHRDWWMDRWIAESPYRNYFHWIWSVCCDSEPPKDEWSDLYSTVDKISSYTDWGVKVSDLYAGEGFLNIADINTMPGCDTNVFKPMDRKEIRAKYGIKDDINIIFKCARNQLRKLYPDLIRSFMETMSRLYKDGHNDIADKTFLYFHTSLADVGWDLINEIKRYSAAHKVLLTYICTRCNFVFISFVQGETCFCPRCGQLSCMTANTSYGVSREILAELYNLADLYVQVQVAGACEIPLLEASAVGCPTLAVDYAAPKELASAPGSLGLFDVACYRQESTRETGQFRAYVDPESISKKLYKFLRMDKSKIESIRKKQREYAVDHFDFDLTAQKWMKLIDEAPLLENDRWYEPPKIMQLSIQQFPFHLPDIQFVKWCCNIFPKNHRFRTYLHEKNLLKKLTLGYEVRDGQSRHITKKEIAENILAEINHLNHFEQHRHNLLVKRPQAQKDNRVDFKVYN